MAIQRVVHDTPHETPWPHVTRQFIHSSQLGRCLCTLDVPSVSAISLKKAHPRGFQLSTLFSWNFLAYGVGCWLDIIKGPSLLLFGRAVPPSPLCFSRAILPSSLFLCHEVHIRIDRRPWHTPCRERERRDLQGHRFIPRRLIFLRVFLPFSGRPDSRTRVREVLLPSVSR